jgi:hypothetical protein
MPAENFTSISSALIAIFVGKPPRLSSNARKRVVIRLFSINQPPKRTRSYAWKLLKAVRLRPLATTEMPKFSFGRPPSGLYFGPLVKAYDRLI